MRLLVALGGNAIKQADQRGTIEEQLRNCRVTTKLLAQIVKQMKEEDRLIITHGNGPQAVTCWYSRRWVDAPCHLKRWTWW